MNTPERKCLICGGDASHGSKVALKADLQKKYQTTHAWLCFRCAMNQED